MKTIALIGAGDHSRRLHGSSYEHLFKDGRTDVAIAGVCDLDGDLAADLAARLGCDRSWTDSGQMLAEIRPDLIEVITPPQYTCDIVRDLCKYNIPLVIEKPPGASYAQAVELEKLMVETKLEHMVSFNRRFAPATRWFESVKSQLPARPQLLIAKMTRIARTESDFVFATGLHIVDAVRNLLGDPCGELISCNKGFSDVAGVTEAHVDFEGTRAQFIFAPNSGYHSETVELIYENHTVTLDFVTGSCQMWRGGEITEQFAYDTPQPRYIADGNLNEAIALFDCLRESGPWWPKMTDVLESVRIAELLQRA